LRSPREDARLDFLEELLKDRAVIHMVDHHGSSWCDKPWEDLGGKVTTE
jgi:hypothetical protein